MNTIIEKIRAEIERLKGICTAQIKANPGQTFPFVMEMTGYDKLLSFLSGLEKECEDFPTTDEEMAKFLATHPKVEVPEKYKTPDWMFEKSEKPSEGLEEEINRTYHDGSVADTSDLDHNSYENIARHFYELGKQGKPKVCEGLEEEIQNQIYNHFFDLHGIAITGTTAYASVEDMVYIARHFAKWGAEHAKIDVTDFCKPIDPGIAQCIADHFWEMLGEDEKSVPNDLEEAAMNYIAPIENEDGLKVINFSGQDIKEAFIAGAKWQEEQDLKYISEIHRNGYNLCKERMMKEAVEGEVTETCGISSVWIKTKQFKPGQKVKVIIVKED